MDCRETFTQRLILAMETRGLSQRELAERTGFSKSRINLYVRGKYEAKQDGVYQLSRALGVNEAWLMGYDCPMDRCPPQARAGADLPELDRLCALYRGMNSEGRELLGKLARSLSRDYPAPPETEGRKN